MADLEFDLRRNFLWISVALTVVMITLDWGGIIKDTLDVVVTVDSEHGLSSTTVDEWLANQPNATTGERWEFNTSVFVSSVGNTRLLLFALFCAVSSWRSIYAPSQCSVLRQSARRKIRRTGREEERGGVSLTLNEVLEAAIEGLDGERELVLLVPAQGVMVPEGPRWSFLYVLLRDVEATRVRGRACVCVRECACASVRACVCVRERACSVRRCPQPPATSIHNNSVLLTFTRLHMVH